LAELEPDLEVLVLPLPLKRRRRLRRRLIDPWALLLLLDVELPLLLLMEEELPLLLLMEEELPLLLLMLEEPPLLRPFSFRLPDLLLELSDLLLLSARLAVVLGQV